jgi:hypothetical protein
VSLSCGGDDDVSGDFAVVLDQKIAWERAAAIYAPTYLDGTADGSFVNVLVFPGVADPCRTLFSAEAKVSDLDFWYISLEYPAGEFAASIDAADLAPTSKVGTLALRHIQNGKKSSNIRATSGEVRVIKPAIFAPNQESEAEFEVAFPFDPVQTVECNASVDVLGNVKGGCVCSRAGGEKYECELNSIDEETCCHNELQGQTIAFSLRKRAQFCRDACSETTSLGLCFNLPK